MANEITLVEDKGEIYKVAGEQFYLDNLDEKLANFKAQLKSRQHWATADLDLFLRKTISTRIVDNELTTKKKLTKKQIIKELSDQLDFPPMAVAHLYDEVYTQFSFNSSKDDAKDYVLTNIYNQIDAMDILIASAEGKEAAALVREKTNLLSLLMNVTGTAQKSNTLIMDNKGTLNVTDSSTTNIQNNLTKNEIQKQTLIELANELLPRRLGQ